MKNRSKTILALLATGLVSCALFSQQAQAVQITGHITFTGSVELNNTSAGNSTAVTAWHGLGAGDKPQVASSDGGFAAFAPPGTLATFFAPWSFNSGPIPSFWTAGGFTFNLTSSTISTQGTNAGGGFVTASGLGTISGNGFTSTPGTWNFSTQDPGAGTPAQFSFSAATGSVPDGGTTVCLLGMALTGIEVLRRKLKGA